MSQEYFHDNKYSRAIHLQHQFANTHIENFPDASTYCQELKVLSDQLAIVGQVFEEDRIVLQMVTGLNDSYDSLQSLITYREKVPTFYEARSMLILEESRKNKQVSSSSTALLCTNSNLTNPLQRKSSPSTQFTPYSHNPQTRGCSRGNYRGNNRGRGRNSS
ncbi:uncharacterized protein [Rutidosis leptorrhynchoides]|uniref:uncharacterized protein n=1 Tax=Rutidosis leptorrhynchoides TaxID=125765 RepID=UPI003A99DBB8